MRNDIFMCIQSVQRKGRSVNIRKEKKMMEDKENRKCLLKSTKDPLTVFIPVAISCKNYRLQLITNIINSLNQRKFGRKILDFFGNHT